MNRTWAVRGIEGHSVVAGRPALHRVVRRGGLFLVGLAWIGLIATLAQATSITFKLDCPAGAPTPLFSPGHAMVQMMPMNNGQPSQTYGFYPNSWNIFGGAGILKNDATRKMDLAITFPVTPAQYNAAAAVINADRVAPPAYNLTSFNCVDWINTVATAAGVGLPPFANRLGISDPNALWISLNGIGNGGAFGGGTVATLAFAGAGMAPLDHTYVGMEAEGHNNPISLAGNIGLGADLNMLGSFAVDASDQLSINISNIAPANSLISVNWGDGSEFDAQATGFTHAYALPGAYNADVLVVDHGTVHSYPMTINVADGVSTESVNIFVNDFGPATGENTTDFPDGAPLLLEVPEPTSLAIAMLGFVGLCFPLRRHTY